jgi:cytochrome oxidase assembly protein ShyY1
VVRTALQLKWLSLLGVVVVLVVAFAWLGRWQLDVAKSKGHHAVKVLPTAPLASVATPQRPFLNKQFDRHVTVTGSYDASRQLLVPSKAEPGQPSARGFWVLTALRTPAGDLVPVLRGWSASASVPAPPAGPVSLTGTIAPAEPAPDGTPESMPAGQIQAADTADVVNLWGGPLYNLLLFPSGPAPAGLVAVPAPSPDTGGGVALLNAAYAVQWWLFALFAVLLWWNMVRQAAADPDLALENPAPEDPPTGVDDDERLPVPAKGHTQS